MMADIAVRPADRDDIDALVHLNAQIQTHHAALHPAFFAPDVDRDAVADLFQRVLTHDANRVWLATADRHPAGYLWTEWLEQRAGLFSHMPQRLLVHHIGVSDRFRRHGIGRELMLRALALAGPSAVELSSWAANAGAHDFFEAMGFQPLRTTFLRPADTV